MSILPWEQNDFPIVCNNCLGKNQYIRFLKSNYNSECKICNRPFTVFSFKNSNDKFKKTEICSLCSKIKNVCQFCLLDLQFGLPIEIRDKYLKNKIELPKEKQNINYFINNFDQTLPYEQKGAYKKIFEKIKDNNEIENIIKENNNENNNNKEKNIETNNNKEENDEINNIDNKNDEEENNNIEFIENVEDPMFKKMMKKYDNPIYNTDNKKTKKKKKIKSIKKENEIKKEEKKEEIKEETKEEKNILKDFGERKKYDNEIEIDKNFLIRKKKRYLDL